MCVPEVLRFLFILRIRSCDEIEQIPILNFFRKPQKKSTFSKFSIFLNNITMKSPGLEPF